MFYKRLFEVGLVTSLILIFSTGCVDDSKHLQTQQATPASNTRLSEKEKIEKLFPLMAVAINGDAGAQALLGKLFEDAGNDKNAAVWYRKSAEQGNGTGQVGTRHDVFQRP